MKLKLHTTAILSFALLLFGGVTMNAQIGINTTTPANGAVLDVSSTDKGFLMPRVTLTGTDDTSTVPSATTGVMVYNTNTVASGSAKITPGFYYWDGASWRRLFTEGYSLKYEQSAEVRASTFASVSVDLPGLDTGTLTIPFSGTYQIIAKGYMSAGDRTGGASGDGATQGSLRIVQSTNSGSFVNIKETYLTSSSKDIDGTNFYNLAQAGTIVLNVELDAGNTYRFKLQGREWRANGVDTGWFGKDTSGYSGANGVNDAQRGSMTISLVMQQ
ncbi:MAG: hypothetical protein AAFP76_13690 [Bacteroidota bacterium]